MLSLCSRTEESSKTVELLKLVGIAYSLTSVLL